MSTQISIHIFLCMSVRIFTNVYMHVYTRVHTHVCTHVYAHVYIHVHKFVHVHVHIHCLCTCPYTLPIHMSTHMSTNRHALSTERDFGDNNDGGDSVDNTRLTALAGSPLFRGHGGYKSLSSMLLTANHPTMWHSIVIQVNGSRRHPATLPLL